MIEVEAKARLTSPEDTERLLLERGAIFQSEVQHHDTYFVHPFRDYASTDEALRIRTEKEGDETAHRLTYKGPKMDQLTKTREEVDVAVGDRDTLEHLLQKLGFTPRASVDKTRKHYSLPPLDITMDHIDELGWFIEVETLVEDKWEEARDGIIAFMNSIGCGELERLSYLELLLEKQRE